MLGNHVFSLSSPASLEYYVHAPIDNHMICFANVDLGYADNMFDTEGGIVNDYVPR